MKRTLSARIKFGMKLGLSRAHATTLAKLTTPKAVQDFVSRIPANHEIGGETVLPVAEVLKQNRAHCIEGAFVAACAFWMQGRLPLLLDLKARAGDSDHVVALFREGRYWGAVSKSNHVWVRYRDPVYRSMRELALSYLHEYTLGPVKTLYSYSLPFDLRREDKAVWISGPESCWDLAWTLDQTRHTPLVTEKQFRRLAKRDDMEMKADKFVEHPRPKKRALKQRKKKTD